MGRYIDVDWLESEFDEANEISFYYLNADSYEAFKELKKIVEQAPSIDIVRCGECKHRGICSGKLVQGTEVVQLNSCSCGERS